LSTTSSSTFPQGSRATPAAALITVTGDAHPDLHERRALVVEQHDDVVWDDQHAHVVATQRIAAVAGDAPAVADTEDSGVVEDAPTRLGLQQVEESFAARAVLHGAIGSMIASAVKSITCGGTCYRSSAASAASSAKKFPA
jgi:hypothetical protein